MTQTGGAAAVAALVAGSMSMAAGEYVSVHSQADTEHADLERERRELSTDLQGEQNELTAIYVRRVCCHDASDETCGRHDAVVGAEHRRAKPADPIRPMSFPVTSPGDHRREPRLTAVRRYRTDRCGEQRMPVEIHRLVANVGARRVLA